VYRQQSAFKQWLHEASNTLLTTGRYTHQWRLLVYRPPFMFPV
jgi:hypothetical protein